MEFSIWWWTVRKKEVRCLSRVLLSHQRKQVDNDHQSALASPRSPILLTATHVLAKFYSFFRTYPQPVSIFHTYALRRSKRPRYPTPPLLSSRGRTAEIRRGVRSPHRRGI